jgi:uncharacterized SAM-binding protein YcdF (DUF218 family)
MRRFFTFARVACTLLGVLLLVVSFTPLVAWQTQRMTVDWFAGDADVLVVLGGSMLVDGTGPQATMGDDSYLRCVYASWYIQKYRYQYVVVSGPDGLAQTMAKYLAANGAKPEQLLIESAARSTFENAEFVKKILEHQPGLPAHPKIAILTSDYHTRRARLVFEHLGLPVHAIPVPDMAKRAGFVTQRWDGFLILTIELAKDGFYRLNGRI